MEALRAGRVLDLRVSASARSTSGMRELLEAAERAQVSVVTVAREILDALGPDHQGVAATIDGAKATVTLTERELAKRRFADDAVVVVLDGVTDPQNLGAAARSAEAAGASMLVTRTRRAAGITPAAVAASAGAMLHLPHARVANIAKAIGRLQRSGFFVVGLDDGAADDIYARSCPSGKVAIVVGSEGEGMGRLVRESCDALVRLPMRGRVGSLNASAALAAALYGYVLPSRSPERPSEAPVAD